MRAKLAVVTYLSVIFEPPRRDLWNTVVDLLLSGGDTLEAGRNALTHGLEQLRVNIFCMVDSLL